MRRVIYAWNYVEWGGAQIHFLALIKEARREFDVVVVLPKGTDSQFHHFLNALKIECVEFEPAVDLAPTETIFDRFRRRRRRLKSEHRMISEIRRIGTQNAIIHTDLIPTQSLLSLIRLCRLTDVFITSHNALPQVSITRWYWMRWKFYVLSAFGGVRVFCTNKHAAEYFKKLYAKKVADRITITYDSINPEEIEGARASDFDRSRILSELNIDAKKFIVLAVGRFIDRKGRWTFLDAAKRVTSQCDDIDFVWLTPAIPSESDRIEIDSYNIGDRFHLVHASSIGGRRDDVLRFFRVGDIYAQPSFVEGLPISLLEAMAIGLPSISTNVYGIPEAIINEKTGLLIEPGDPDSLAAAILNMKNDPDLRRRLADAGREHVLRSFDEREAARIAISEYKRAFNARQ